VNGRHKNQWGTDDYSHDGRVLFEILDRDALPRTLSEHDATLSRLAAA
jgi:hypothetical protein